MGHELRPGALLPASALGLWILVWVTALAVGKRAGTRALHRRLGRPADVPDAPDLSARQGGRTRAGLGKLIGLDLPPTAMWCLAATGGLLGLLAGELLSLGGAGRLLACACGATAVLAWRSTSASARGRNLAPMVHSFVQEVHLSAVAGETAIRALAQASGRAPEPLRGVLQQARLAVQAGEDIVLAYGNIRPIRSLPEYQGLLYALWLHEQTGCSLAELLGSTLEQTDETLLARSELAAKLGEARWTARVLILVPVALLAYMYLAQPDLVAPLSQDPLGRQALAVGALLWLAGLGISTRMQRPPRGLHPEG